MQNYPAYSNYPPRYPVNEEDSAPPRPLFTRWEFWGQALLTALLTALLLGALFSPWIQDSYDISDFISQCGLSWFSLVIPAILELPGAIFTTRKLRETVNGWKLAVALLLELAVVATLFYVIIMHNFSFLEFPDPDSGETRYYFGQTMGQTATGYGRVFDKDKNLIYKGYFDNNMYHGHGKKYSYDQEYTFGKEDGQDPHLRYEGEFRRGEFDGNGTYYGVDSKGTGSFRDGFCNGEVKWWYLTQDTREVLLYEGEYLDGYKQGFGEIRRSDGTLHTKGFFAQGWLVYGTIYDKNENPIYSGGWAVIDDYNTQNGRGFWYYTGGNPCYHGDFVNGRKNGYGTEYREDGVTPIYEGSWKDDQYNGWGTLYMEDGVTRIYEGDWKDGKYHGWGTTYQADGVTEDQAGWFEDGEYFGPEAPAGAQEETGKE